jgi:hypothetical protein
MPLKINVLCLISLILSPFRKFTDNVALSLGVKRPGCEADHSPHVVPRSKNEWNYNSTPQYAFMAWCSSKSQGQLQLLPLPLLNINRNIYLWILF